MPTKSAAAKEPKRDETKSPVAQDAESKVTSETLSGAAGCATGEQVMARLDALGTNVEEIGRTLTDLLAKNSRPNVAADQNETVDSDGTIGHEVDNTGGVPALDPDTAASCAAGEQVISRLDTLGSNVEELVRILTDLLAKNSPLNVAACQKETVDSDGTIERDKDDTGSGPGVGPGAPEIMRRAFDIMDRVLVVFETRKTEFDLLGPASDPPHRQVPVERSPAPTQDMTGPVAGSLNSRMRLEEASESIEKIWNTAKEHGER
jgi:hypothetical protein